MSALNILIASCKIDEPTWKPVADLLSNAGHRVTTIETDEVVAGNTPLTIGLEDTGIALTYAGQHIRLHDFDAAWYRRPALFGYLEPSAVRQHTLFREVNALLQAVWREVPSHAWLNTPEALALAERKITQLKVARQMGFSIPSTVISNHWPSIKSTLSNDVIVKSSYGMLDAGTDLKLLYTHKFDKDKLPVNYNPFPGIWQEYLSDKRREWRVTIVGKEVFGAAIYTEAEAKDDWRKLQGTAKVKFVEGVFPPSLANKCIRFLEHFNLRFGAFDFVEHSDGDFTFLECNTNGQYGWLEDELGLPISQSIANMLVAIGSKSPQVV